MSIEIRSLVKTYDDFRVEMDLRVESDETLVLAGPSGCGKTTALQMIAGLIAPDSGDILVDGASIGALPAWKRSIGIVFQDLALFPHLTVGGNVAYGPSIAGKGKEERRQIAEECLRTVRLSGYAARGVHTLSGGEKQRVAIARALAARPKALLMDEPFSSLDAPLRRSLRAEFRSIRTAGGFPCIFVTHDREEAAAVGDRIAVMDSGRIVECGSPFSLFNEPRTAFVARFLGAGSLLSGAALRVLPRAQGPLFPDAGESLLVPHDAVSLVPSGDERADAEARIVEVGFEGDGTGIEAELEGTGVRLRARLDRRIAPPRIGERVALRIDWHAVRKVRGS